MSAVQCKCSPTPLSLPKHNREFREAESFAEGTKSLAVSTDKYIVQNHTIEYAGPPFFHDIHTLENGKSLETSSKWLSENNHFQLKCEL